MKALISGVLSLLLAAACSSRNTKSPETLPSFQTTEEAEAYLKTHKKCPGCDLRKAELSYADLRGADLRSANLRGADLNHADLRGANLAGAILVRADLSTKTRLEGADLRDCNLQEANIGTAELALSNTCGAILPDGQRAEKCKE